MTCHEGQDVGELLCGEVRWIDPWHLSWNTFYVQRLDFGFFVFDSPSSPGVLEDRIAWGGHATVRVAWFPLVQGHIRDIEKPPGPWAGWIEARMVHIIIHFDTTSS